MTEIGELQETSASGAYGRNVARGKRRMNGHRTPSIRGDDEYRAIWQKRYDQAIAEGMSPSIATFCAKQHLRNLRRADAGVVERLDVLDYDVDAFAAWR